MKGLTKLAFVIISLSFTAMLVITFLPQSSSAQSAPWYDNNWSFRKNITFNSSRIGEDNLTNFPALISITDSNLSTFAQADGDDILFTLNNGTTKLDHEIEFYNNSNGNLTAWVRIPALRNMTANTSVFMYYNNSAATSQQNRTGVWNANYSLVYHLAEGATTRINDSTFRGNNASKAGTASPVSNNTLPQIDGYQVFDGTNDRINATDSAAGINNQLVTFSTWVYRTSQPSAIQVYLSNSDTLPGTIWREAWTTTPTTSGFKAGFAHSGTTANGEWQTTGDFSLNTWHYIVVVMNASSTSNAPLIYVNGSSVDVAVNIPPTGTFSTGFDTINVGEAEDFTLDFAGRLDEVRIMNILQAEGWIITEYNNQAGPGNFYTLGAAEGVSAPQCNWNANQDVVCDCSSNNGTNGLDIAVNKINITGSGTIEIVNSNISFTELNIQLPQTCTVALKIPGLGQNLNFARRKVTP